MAFLNDIKTAIAAGSAQTLITVPVGAEVALSTLFFNAVGGTANITLNLDRQASGTNVDLLEDYPITDDLPYHFPKPIMLQEGDVLTFSCTGNNINGMVGYYQEGVATTTAGVLNPRGEYSGAATYNRLDVVEEANTSYIQLNDGITADAPPSVNWMILAKPPATYAWGNLTGVPSDVTNITSLLAAKLALAGGTMTGLLTILSLNETTSALAATTTPSIDISLASEFTHTTSGNTTYTVTGTVAGKAWVRTLVITLGGAHTPVITGADWGDVGAPDDLASGDEIEITLRGIGSSFRASETWRATA